jgi:hypothetical protein
MSINARFEHLDTGQRNHIYHAVRGAGSLLREGHDDARLLLRVSERRRMVRRMARRFGVKQATVEAVYIHLHERNRTRRREQQLIADAVRGR